MATFTLKPSTVLSDCVIEYPPNGDVVYNVKDALAAGGGHIVTTNDSLIAILTALTVSFGVPAASGGLGQPVPHDSFSERFADRIYRRRAVGQMLSVALLDVS